MGLKVIVVGAGIAGLTAALALRKAGHSVEIFERSAFAKEVGAALGLTPNGSRVLDTLGFSFTRARAREITSWDVIDGVTLKLAKAMDFTGLHKQFGFSAYAVHRVDFHTELLYLAQQPGTAGEEPVALHLSSAVVDGDAEEGWIQLQDGSKHHADLIVGADGIHSVLRPLVTGCKDLPRSTDLTAFRFLIQTDTMSQDPALQNLMDWKSTGAVTLADPHDSFPQRHMMWYDCQDGEVQNFVGITRTGDIPTGSDGKPDFNAAMLRDFQAYHPDLKHVIKIAKNVTCWPLIVHDVLSSWSKGKMVLVGDAAHPMLPFGGQGSNQAIEDAGALGYLFADVDEPTDVPERFGVFEKTRINRVSIIQTLSTVRAGNEKTVEDALRKYYPPGAKIPTSMAERNWNAFSHNVLQAAEDALMAQQYATSSSESQSSSDVEGSEKLSPQLNKVDLRG